MEAREHDLVTCRPIGYVRSRFDDPVGTPIQTVAAQQEVAQVEVLAPFVAGLRDIEGFGFLILLTHFHKCLHERLEVTPFLDDQTHGVFATRAPTRPNRLGISIVQLLRVEGAVLHVAGNDMVDGTPVLDIKPYLPEFDVRATQRIGWFADRLSRLPDARADDRMA
ncbi:tRNA (N6-threonylcarbamoyladenosine(37)-N6)-methyltransferase TrmO [Variovorax sp. J22R133]|uniref:tRNA (N6-threonylcarbamoyladenosine(37)-N6)-methyltransferase TrmO n=1 Tax=Variovorax brevis TaxID=3053503 RepID=UPI002577E726|nr:tRNA (N6-threonylcarbamoyladenosine(37)-N6)-methyltransferase TrmO [Variovorax sp. J22R133]MDM0111809.1 tRNA (N6-threonylcarbamoyladenosine(37)-N6)-methyltransferase TrmO [Variovorax sp. J22R133]